MNPRVPKGHRFSKPAPYRAWLPQQRNLASFTDTRSGYPLLHEWCFIIWTGTGNKCCGDSTAGKRPDLSPLFITTRKLFSGQVPYREFPCLYLSRILETTTEKGKSRYFYSALISDWRVMIPNNLPLSITGTELIFFFSIKSITVETSAVRSTEMSGELMISFTSRFRIR